jgi:hypothetical protein
MLIRIIVTLAIVSLASCSDSAPSPSKATPTTQAAVIPAALFAGERPADAPDLASVKASAKKGDHVVFLARVGGKGQPFIDSASIFIVADPALLSCELMGEEDHCPKPWDYCCEESKTLKNGLATIQVLDTQGRPFARTAEGAGGLASLKYVVVDGTVSDRNDDGLFIVNADRIWVGGVPNRSDHRAGSL